jgi:hypothetical protein
MIHRRAFFFATVLTAFFAQTAQAHSMKAGDLTIEHPYATPSLAGQTTGAVYFRRITNGGGESDQLLSASTPVAAAVELHRMRMEGDVMRMRAVSAIELPAHSEVPLRHGQADGHHLMLLGLKAPLKEGDRFPLTLTFQRAGTREVMVWVQTPRDAQRPEGHQH